MTDRKVLLFAGVILTLAFYAVLKVIIVSFHCINLLYLANLVLANRT